MNTSLKNATHLKKKVYSLLNSKTLNKIEKIEINNETHQGIKLNESRVLKNGQSGSLRDQFKKIFLPLLIDILELRQSIDNFKISNCNDVFSKIGKKSKSAKEVLAELEKLNSQIQESKRWHDGIIRQITRSIQEAKESLSPLRNEQNVQQGWLKKLTKFLRAQ